MPAPSAVWTAAFDDGRSGSMIPTMPTNARSWVSDIGSALIASSSPSSTKPRGEREHAQALLAHALVRGVDAGAGLLDRHLRAAHRAAGEGAAREHDVGAALDELDHALVPSTVIAVEGGHELVVGVERHLGDARIGPAGLLRVDAELGREHDERRLRRVADHASVVADGRVAVEDEPEREPREVGHRGAGDRREGAASCGNPRPRP